MQCVILFVVMEFCNLVDNLCHIIDLEHLHFVDI